MNDTETGSIVALGWGADGVIETNMLVYGSVASTASNTNAIRLSWVSLQGWADGDVVTLTMSLRAPGSTAEQMMRVQITNEIPREWTAVTGAEQGVEQGAVRGRDFGAGLVSGVLLCGLAVTLFVLNARDVWRRCLNW